MDGEDQCTVCIVQCVCVHVYVFADEVPRATEEEEVKEERGGGGREKRKKRGGR